MGQISGGEECPRNHYRAPDPNSNVTVNPNTKQVADIGGTECPVMWLANRRCLVPGNDRRYRGVRTAKYPVPQTAKSTSQYVVMCTFYNNDTRFV